MDLRGLMTKLQRALCMRGQIIRIYTMQTYIEDSKRMATKYKLVETLEDPTGKKHNETLLETYRLSEVVQFLGAKLGGDASAAE